MIEKQMEGREDKKHTVQLVARRALSLSGITDVRSFDEQSVELVTDCGRLVVEGEALHVGTLDIAGGVVEIQGQICALYYSSENNNGRKRRNSR